MDSAQKQLQRVAPAMKRAHLEGVLIDDAAAALQGAKLAPMRLVFFVASMSPRALRRLALDLQAQASHSRHARHLRSLRLDVDFVSYAAGVKNFGTVQNHASTVTVGSQPVLVADLRDVMKIKHATVPVDRVRLHATREAFDAIERAKAAELQRQREARKAAAEAAAAALPVAAQVVA